MREYLRTVTLLTAGVFMLAAAAPAPANDDDHGEILFYSTEDGSGQIVAEYPFDDHIHLGLSICAQGSCLYTAESPGFVAAEPGQELTGRFLLDDFIQFTVELVAISPEASIRSGAVILDTPGQILRLGLSPFHLDPLWQLELPEGVVGDASITFRVTSSAPFYGDSEEYTITITNEEEHHETTTTLGSVTTTTLDGPSVCGDGVVSGAETCDDGDDQWSMGLHCAADCSTLACGDPDDSGITTVTDSLFTLQSAVGIAACDPCVCDVDSNGSVATSDALRSLQVATGAMGVELVCSVCD